MLSQKVLSYNLHIFDLDDTLIQTQQTYTQAHFTLLQEYAKQIAFPSLTEAQLLLQKIISIVGSSNPHLYWYTFLSHFQKKPSPVLIQELEEKYFHIFFSQLQACNGVVKWLTYLQKQGKQIAIASNGKSIYQKKKLFLTRLDLYFSPSLTLFSDEGYEIEAKPSPTMLNKLCQLTNTCTQDTIFYGNTTTDMLAAKLCDVDSVLYGNVANISLQIASPTYAINSWTSLLKEKTIT